MTIITSSAQDVIDRAPHGAIIRFSDGTPQPPARFKRKLRAWADRNGSGRLTGRRDARDGRPGDFALHLGDCGSNEVISLSVNRLYTADSRGTFVVERVPQPGDALVLTEYMGCVELRHVARNAAVAGVGLEAHRYSNARIDVVQDAADVAAAA